jgi:hypothetical protein
MQLRQKRSGCRLEQEHEAMKRAMRSNALEKVEAPVLAALLLGGVLLFRR